ncbi:MAG TPA: YtxH domain-containing protein [Nitrospirota bacterium]|nr:YtxH domain-containing protein [Nitrospirota bacterium]
MKEEMDNKKRNWTLYSFLGGGILGLGLGLLLAPKPGQETRNDIKEFAARTREKVGKTIDDSMHVYEKSKNAVSSAINCGVAAFGEEEQRQTKSA